MIDMNSSDEAQEEKKGNRLAFILLGTTRNEEEIMFVSPGSCLLSFRTPHLLADMKPRLQQCAESWLSWRAKMTKALLHRITDIGHIMG